MDGWVVLTVPLFLSFCFVLLSSPCFVFFSLGTHLLFSFSFRETAILNLAIWDLHLYIARAFLSVERVCTFRYPVLALWKRKSGNRYEQEESSAIDVHLCSERSA